ncbi:MAG: hypothetical protein JST01_02340 [Cyanobacteria bacterium SZAS TMP-1]|nr:hypothetical protein [Cyanobacteria bacterium SZAS TMP-1]
MILQTRYSLVFTAALAAGLGLATTIGPALAQGSPLPGGGAPTPDYSGYQVQTQPPSAGVAPTASAPVPGGGHASTTGAAAITGRSNTPGSKYRDLPLTVDSTKYRLDELRAMLAVSRPQDMQDSVQELCEWLNDAADAHYRMHLAFAKSDLTKSQANSEKQLNLRFGQLKREAQLLRADLLIKQLRAPEALAPLVDIVVADPRSSTGQQAYKRLVELGFSQAIAAPEAAAAANPSASGNAATILSGATVPVTAPSTAPVLAPVKAPAVTKPVAKPTH